ncbi:MAG: hypothetical protein ACO1OD_02075 [Croceibacterium sp.]
MDFTYIIAGFISVVVGALGSGVFLLLRGESFWRLLAITVPIAIVVDFALLLDWSQIEPMTTAFFLTDLAFFSVYALIGCSLGALPFFGARKLCRVLRSDVG